MFKTTGSKYRRRFHPFRIPSVKTRIYIFYVENRAIQNAKNLSHTPGKWENSSLPRDNDSEKQITFDTCLYC